MILETHGGEGRIYERAWYQGADGSVVMEKDKALARHLAEQRETWAVFEVDALQALRAGALSDHIFDIIDLDPPGSCLEWLTALQSRHVGWPDEWHLVVEDTGRANARKGKPIAALGVGRYIDRFGPDLHRVYLDVCRAAVHDFAASIGFELSGWTGYYCGAYDDSSHFWATLRRA